MRPTLAPIEQWPRGLPFAAGQSASAAAAAKATGADGLGPLLLRSERLAAAAATNFELLCKCAQAGSREFARRGSREKVWFFEHLAHVNNAVKVC
ncbi:hypothetical protein MTO96_026075 [Rhipicephalus appendiculatus]